MTIAARPTVYRGILMRSRLEATWAAAFDRAHIPWEYEPVAFAGRAGQYLPDFRFPPIGLRSRVIYIEVRGTLERAFLAMAQMPIIWESDPTAELRILVTADGLSFRLHPDDPVWRLDSWAPARAH